ncbi:hypothetical protein X759_31200 [Mesorhizobium sp. LSHC420B00]|nr:hypothetical protein X759_31200 [Mesorhizobium sp. LSHC420B00]
MVRIRPERIFCSSSTPARCVALLGQDPLYFDDNHLNSIGAAMLAEAIVNAMAVQGR